MYCGGVFGFYLTSDDFTLGSNSSGAVNKNDTIYHNNYTGGDRNSGSMTMDLDVSNVNDYRYITALVYRSGESGSGGHYKAYEADVYSIYGTIKSDYNGYNVIQDYSTRLIDN